MSHSLSTLTDLTCPRCGQTFQAEVWVIVDPAERLDLLERLRAGNLHTLACPHCGQAFAADSPLLLVFSQAPLQVEERAFRLVFVPARGTGAEEDRQHLPALLAACETGVPSDLETMDEVVSLPAGMMQAGLPGVIGSLWSLAESSTAILMSIFFEEWRKNCLTPPQALHRAQQILRDAHHKDQARHYFARFLMPRDVAAGFDTEMIVENFAHPFYWAAFTYTGL